MGDLNVIERAQLCATAVQCMTSGTGRLASFPGLIKKIIREQAWESRQIRTGKTVELRNLAELITKTPLDGWGEDPRKVEALIKDDPEALVAFREAMKQQGGDRRSEDAEPKSDNIRLRKDGCGTSKAYTLSRLQRESPELFKAVCNGELSANAAAIKAGFRKVPTRVEKMESLWRNASEAEREEFTDWVEKLSSESD